MRKVIHIVLVVVILGLTYAVYASIEKKIAFKKEVARRSDIVKDKLTKIKDAELVYKDAHQKYCKTFNELINFIKNDSLPVIKSEGTRPDSIATDAEAVKLGIIKRDTLMIAVKDTLRNLAPFDSLAYIPFSGGQKFDLDAGQIERGKVNVPVFKVFAAYKYILNGMDLTYSEIKPEEGLQIGSMKEPSTSGNW